MDIQFHLSCSDACPNAVIEGLMAGLPVISPLNTGTSELLEPFSDKWCRRIIWYEFFPVSYKLLPRLPIKKYLKVFKHIFDNLEEYKYQHMYAVQKYDIKTL